ncbi:hypothetical protein DFR48_106142 [Ciceribacter lividus]|uniref:Uncharacterized protein n=1 Tax=Ciceribacter lividus TaxID=1197950 RepID=A0A6I7HKW6_9HYPH|nr:hypothetical protein DFR48_106142 [Ciceribacter lividus]
MTGNIRWQIEDDEGSPAVPATDGQRHKSIRLGPILAVDFSEHRTTVTLKYLTDVYSRSAFDGDYLQLSFIRKIW